MKDVYVATMVRLVNMVPSFRLMAQHSTPLLRQIKHVLGSTLHQQIWAICCRVFLGELLLLSVFDQRRHLAWGDIAVDNQDNPHALQIHLKQSKRDQFGRRVNVVLGTNGRDLCPVAAELNYRASRGTHPGPFFISTTSCHIVKSGLITDLRKIIATLGLPHEQFADHSFRIGAATKAAVAGSSHS